MYQAEKTGVAQHITNEVCEAGAMDSSSYCLTLQSWQGPRQMAI